ncbi:MAG: GHMP kinase [Anaerolineae bacterium]|nr:GHMP kinase [Anaerolineae bacterium]
MIIVQTPLRVSFFGGGTDFPSYYTQEGGCVLGTAIDKYIFVTIKERFDRKLRVGWTKTEMVDSVDEVHHELIREALRMTGIREGVEITTMGDIPSEGSGLGSSATVTVGALHAMYSLLGELVPAENLAQEACRIEIDILNKPSGVQDQYLAAFGGFRFMDFRTDGSVRSERIPLTAEQRKKLNESTMLFFTGVTRRSDSVLTEQKQNIQNKLSILKEMKHITYTAREEVLAGNVDAIGHLLHESWILKRQLASQISNGMLDEVYCLARKAGAIGGKISGAGGGGFLLLYCPYECQDSVRKSLSGLQELHFKLEPDGSKVIFNYLRA